MIALTVCATLLWNFVGPSVAASQSIPECPAIGFAERGRQFQREANVVLKIVHGLNWTSLGIYTDSLSGLGAAVLQQLSDSQTFRVITLSRFSNQQFSHLANSGFFNDVQERLHVIICQHNCVQEIINLLSDVVSQMFWLQSKWIIIANSSMMTDVKLTNVAYLNLQSSESVMCTKEQLWTQLLDAGTKVFKPVEDINVCRNDSPPSSIYRDRLFPNLRLDLKGRTILVGVSPWYPYVLDKVNLTDKYTGLGITILEELSKHLNFRIRYQEAPPTARSKWGYLLQSLIDKKLDILACPYFQTAERVLLVDFPYPVSFNKIRAYYKIWTEVDLRWRLLVDLLTWPAIAVIMSTLLGTAVVLATFSALQDRQRAKFTETKSLNLCRTFRDIILRLVGNLLKQGQAIYDFKAFSSRLVFSSWCVFCLLLAVTFTANLVPALGVVKQPVLFQSLRDVIDHGGYKWGMYGDGMENGLFVFFKNSLRRDHQDIFRGLIEFNKTDRDIFNQEVAVHTKRLLTEKYVFFSSQDTMEQFYVEHCDLAFIESIVEFPFAFPVSKKSEITHLLSKWITRFHENGQIEHWRRLWIPRRNCAVKTTQQSTLNLDDLQSVFVLICVGTTLSAIVFVLEKGIYKYMINTGHREAVCKQDNCQSRELKYHQNDEL